jgi:hypothetical protein
MHVYGRQMTQILLTIKPKRCINFSNLFWNSTVHASDSFSVHHQESSTVHTAIGICHTGYADCLLEQHVEFHSKNKFEKLVHLVGFIVRIHHDARSSECQIRHKTSLRYCIALEPQPFKIRTAYAIQFLVSFRVLKEE